MTQPMTPERNWPARVLFSILGLSIAGGIIYRIATGGIAPVPKDPSGPSADLFNGVKFARPGYVACTTEAALDREGELANDPTAQLRFVADPRNQCVFLRPNSRILVDGHGGFGIVKIHAEGSPDFAWSAREAMSDSMNPGWTARGEKKPYAK